MSPAIISSVVIEGNPEDEESGAKAIVTLPSDQKSKAIGKSGINIRLASMLTGYAIELVEQGSSATNEEATPLEEKKEDLSSLEALFGE